MITEIILNYTEGEMVIRKEFSGMLQSFELEEVEERVGVLFENCLNHINNGRE